MDCMTKSSLQQRRENLISSTTKGSTGRAGLKSQQPTANERRVLSDISNSRIKPRPSIGTPKPSPKTGLSILRGDNILSKPAAPPQSAQGKQQARIPLRNIVNEAQPVPSRTSKVKPSQRRRPAIKVRLTEEQLRQAEEWAREDLPVEKVHFSGDDMEALRQKLMEAEIEETVNMVRNYRVERSSIYSEPLSEEMESIYYEDGRLKPDLLGISDDLALKEHPDIELPTMEPDFQAQDVSFSHGLLEDVDNFPYPSISDDWHVAQTDNTTVCDQGFSSLAD